MANQFVVFSLKFYYQHKFVDNKQVSANIIDLFLTVYHLPGDLNEQCIFEKKNIKA
jgi:hypothetical protein